MKSVNISSRNAAWLLIALLLLLIVAIASSRSAVSINDPRLWSQRDARVNTTALENSLAWQSLRLPPAQIVENQLREQGKLTPGAHKAEVEAAIQTWYAKFHKEYYTGPNPFAYRDLLEREKTLLADGAAGETADFGDDEKLPTPPKELLGVVVEFNPEGGEETVNRPYPVDPADPSLGCSDQDFTYEALGLDQDPPPGPADNFTFYKPGITVADYQSAFFETGPDAGYGVVRPDLGGIDLSGISLNNYLLENSRGTYTAGGGFLNDPLSLSHSHEYYGYAVYTEDEEGNCVASDGSDANYGDFAFNTLEAITAAYDGDASIDWSNYDANDDHIIDLLVIVHAGYGWQNGGGIDRLSTSSSGFFEPQQIVGFGTPADENDDYFVQGFNVDPEQLDVGAIQEEFEHQFGLPDIYVVDGNNSNAWWGAHSSGVWGGPLGGTRPVGHNLWQDWVLGWRDPLIINYDDPQLLDGSLEVDLGRARYTPEGTSDGVIVRLPDQGVEIPNLAGEGTGWYSDSGDLLDNRVYRDFDLTAATTPVTFSFDSWWDIEEDWDYGLIEFSTDSGTIWETIPDEDGILTDEDPNDIGVVIPGEAWGLTGAGEGTITFDISVYAGETLTIRLRYLTDPAVINPGWQVDNLLLTDDGGTLYENDLEEDFSDWTNEGWITVPLNQIFSRYYLLEWRDDNGFDQSLNDVYQFVYASETEPPPESIVDRLPATTSGLLVAYRNTSQDFDYAIYDALFDGQSIGTNFAHLVVDSHFMPKRFDTPDPNDDNLVGIKLSGRVLPGDAAFGHTETEEWTSRLQYDPVTDTSVETKTWESEAPIAAFHDSYGYYPGLFFSDDTGFVYFNDDDASVVLPAKGPYTTRITDPSGALLLDLFGATVAGYELGTGNPGDSHVHFGLHAEVVDGNDLRATVRLWNKPYEAKIATETGGSIASGEPLTTTLQITENIGGRLENPLVIVTLPDGVTYAEGSGFGGLLPVGDEELNSAADVAAFVAANGRESLARLRVAAADATYLVWAGDDIWTGGGTDPFGFGWTAAEDTSQATFEVTLYRNNTDEVQSQSFGVSQFPYASFLPVSSP